MNVISFYPRYERLGASSRLRTYQFLPKLEQSYLIKINALLSNKYITNLYSNRKQNKFKILISYFKRFTHLLNDNSDLIIIEKELFPFLPYCFEYFILRNKKYIIDIDDAWFHIYEGHHNISVRKLLGNKIHQLMKNAQCVFAGSPYLQEIAQKDMAKNVVYIPTVIDLDKYCFAPVTLVNSSQIVIGWIGNNGTVKYLTGVFGVLERLAQNLPHIKVILRVVGANLPKKLNGIVTEELTWSEEAEVELINTFDIGIMPLENNLWERGKCAYKLIQYMACAKPVIASAVGANNVVVHHGVDGYLCSTDIEWYNYFLELIIDRSKRIQMGNMGRYNVEQHYTTSIVAEQKQRLFEEIICAG